jgi:hypothetical protein
MTADVKFNDELTRNIPADFRGGIHSEEMIEMKWSRSSNPGFLLEICGIHKHFLAIKKV